VKLLLDEKRISTKKKTNSGRAAIDIANANVVKLIQEFDSGNYI